MKNKVNILFILSVAIFVVSGSLHLYNKKTIAVGFMTGSGGGRISSITYIPPSTPPVTQPCPNLHYYTLLAPSSGPVNMLCAPQVNIPKTGTPINESAIGRMILGNWTATYPTAQSVNWGTSYQ